MADLEKFSLSQLEQSIQFLQKVENCQKKKKCLEQLQFAIFQRTFSIEIFHLINIFIILLPEVCQIH